MATRRAFLKGAAGFGLWTGLAIPRIALAAAPVEQRFLLVILRGGMDGLAALPPYAEPDYARLREGLALAPPGREHGVIDLDGRFGLHPALARLAPFYHRKELLPIHAIAIGVRTRSHFDAQDLLENGAAYPRGARDGWLNRALAQLQGEDRWLGLALGHAIQPVLRGPVPVASWGPARLPASSPDLLDTLAALYGDDPLFAKVFAEGRRAEGMTSDILGGSIGMGADERRGPRQFGTLIAAAGRLLAAQDGPRVGVVEIGGWDTHYKQGCESGRLASQLAHVSNALAKLPELMGPAWRQTVVAVVTEFGRTVRMNGTGGTDHGTAGAAFLLGGAVAGGRVATRWPGIGPDNLYQGRDLLPTSDMRGMFKTVLQDHFGLNRATLNDTVFPGSAAVLGPPGPLIRT